MDSDEEWFETINSREPYIVRPRSNLRSPLYPSVTTREDVLIKDSPLTGFDHLSNIRNYIWNRNTRRFCARDGLEWAKLGCFYSIFFFVLGVIFSAFVIVYILLLDKKTPRRLGNESALAFDNGINPGKTIGNFYRFASNQHSFFSRTRFSTAVLYGSFANSMAYFS